MKLSLQKEIDMLQQSLDYHLQLFEKAKTAKSYKMMHDESAAISNITFTLQYLTNVDAEENNHDGMKLNKNGTNAAITATILPDEQMREIGFTDCVKDSWFFCVSLVCEKSFRVTLNVTIPKNGSDIRIDVLDDAFCQPYDYQYMLSNNPNFEPALKVRNAVEKWMKYLQDRGVLHGHNENDYI